MNPATFDNSYRITSFTYFTDVLSGRNPKMNQINAFWEKVWKEDISTLVKISESTRDQASIGCVYWPVVSTKPLEVSSELKVTLHKEEILYAANNQLLIERKFLLESNTASRTVVQITCFPDPLNEVFEKAAAAAKKAHAKGSKLLVMHAQMMVDTLLFLTYLRNSTFNKASAGEISALLAPSQDI